MMCDFMSVLGRVLLIEVTIFSGESKTLVRGGEGVVCTKARSRQIKSGEGREINRKEGGLLFNGKVSIWGLDSCVAITLSVQLKLTLSVIFES
jgi:hypothetical protein